MYKIKCKLFFLVALVFIAGCSDSADESAAPTSQMVPAPGFEDVPEAVVVDPGSSTSVKEFDITAKEWDFQPSTIEVNRGDQVKLNIKSIDIKHGFALADFGINKDLNPGETTMVEFTADKSGTFTFFCSVYCGSGHEDMNGRLIVKE